MTDPQDLTGWFADLLRARPRQPQPATAAWDGDWGEEPVARLAAAELARLHAERRWHPDRPLRPRLPILLEVRDRAGHQVLVVAGSRLGPLLIAGWHGPRDRAVREEFLRAQRDGWQLWRPAVILVDLPYVAPPDPAAHTMLEPICADQRCGRFVLDPNKVRAAIPAAPPRRTIGVHNLLL